MKKYNSLFLQIKRTIIFRIVSLLTISFLFSHSLISQVINLNCQDETVAVEDLERKDWETTSGSTAIHSEGSMHNFTLPTIAEVGPCKIISNISISIIAIGTDLSNLPVDCAPTPQPFFYNIALGCPDFTPASCNTANLIGESNSTTFTNQNFSYNGTFDLGDNLSIDIVPVMNINCTNGQSALSSNSVVLDYEICVTVTVIDATPTGTVDLGGDLDICPGTTTMIDAGTFDDYIWSPGGQTTQTITTGMGTYNITVTDNAGCTSTDEIIINDFPDSPITFDPVNPNGCDGGSVQVSVDQSYGMYNWSNALTGQVVTLSPSPTPYTVTITDSNLCTFESSIMVGDIAPPDAGSGNFITVCNDGSLTNMDLQLGAHDSGGSWSDDNGSGVDVNANPLAVDFSSLAPNTYDFTYTVTGTAPCLPAEATIVVQVIADQEAGDPNFISVCEGEQVDLTNWLSSDANTGGTFSDDNFTNQLIGNNFSTNGLAGNSYDFTYSVGGAPCQVDDAIITIQVLGAVEAGQNNFTTTVCEGAQVDLSLLLSSDATSGGSFSDDDFTTQLSGNTFNTTGLPSNTYNFTYFVGTAGSACGDDMAFFTVNVEASLTSGIPVGEDVCEGEMIDLFTILMGEDTGGIFSDISGNGGLSNNMLNTTGLPVGISEYQYLVGDGILCPKDSSTIAINIVAAPSLDIAVDSIDVCANNCETITYTLSGTAPFSFNASIFSNDGTLVGGGINNTNTNTFTITACNQTNTESFINDTLNLLIDSSYTITIPSIEDGNCTNNFGGGEDTLFIRALNYARFDLDTVACISDTLTINGTEFFLGNDTYQDTIPGSRCDSIISIMVNFQDADTVSISEVLCAGDSTLIGAVFYGENNLSDTITVNNPNGCDSLTIINISFYPIAESMIMVPLCAGSDTLINGTVYNDTNMSGVDTLFNQSSTFCDSIVTVQINITSNIIINRNDTLCMDESIVIGGQTFDSNNQMDQILLSGSGCDTTINVALTFLSIEEGSLSGPFCSDFNENINGTDYNFFNRTGTETLENAGINGCDSIVNVNLMFYPPAENTVLENLCSGDSLFVGGAFQFVAGDYIDTLQSINGCDSILTTSLSFDPCQFNINISISPDICGDGLSGSILIETNSPTGEIFTIVLTDEDGNTEEIQNINGPNISGTFSPLAAGIYTIDIIDVNGAIVDTRTVTILSPNDPITGSWSVINPIDCEDGTGSIMYDAIGGQDPFTYSWSDASIGNTPTAENLSAGSYAVTVTDIQGCTGTATFQLDNAVNQVPIIEVVDPSCETANDGSILITNLDDASGPYTITINGDSVDSTFIDGLTANIYNIIITDANLCEIEAIGILASTNQLQFAQYAEEYTITIGDSLRLVGTVDDGDFIYEWNGENSLTCLDCPFPIVAPIETSLYFLTISDENGCSQELSVTVFVEEMEEEEEEEEVIVIEIANIFSPNGDNINEEVIFNFGPDKVLAVEIFDRWGNRIFQDESVDGIITWAGFFNGNRLASGVYVYNLQITDLEGNTESKFGDIMLMR